MINQNFNVVTWTSGLSEEESKRVIRSKASALGWRRRSSNRERRQQSRDFRNVGQIQPKIEKEVQAYDQYRRMSQQYIPPQVNPVEPQGRLLPTFIPRFEMLIGPDTRQILALSHNDDLVQEATDCLIVGVCSNITFDGELRSSAVQRYGALLPKIQARVTSRQDAGTSSTLSLIFMLGIQEAMVWKSFGNSQTHIAGWGRVIEMCGPQFFSSPDTLFVFRMFRMNAVTLHLRLRKPLFLASEEWMTVPWFCLDKDLFDSAYDLLVQIPGLLANVEEVKGGQLAPTQMQANVGKFIRQLHRWLAESLFPRASAFVPAETSWTLDQVVSYVQDGTIPDFTFARGFTHYLAALLIMSQFGQRCVDSLPMKPENAIQSILAIIRKQTLDNDQGALWPWFVPLRVAHFSPFAQDNPEIVPLCLRLEQRYSWPILSSERYMMYSKQTN